MPRRSGRLRKPGVGSSVWTMDSDSGSETTTSDPPPKKARKVRGSKPDAEGSKPKKTRGKQGRLEQITEMPLDILFEIFAHLTPYDLLNLSRTSKPLRNILMHRSSTYVWKNVRSRIVDLPECPKDLSEPQYANLIFYPYCHFCLKAQVPSKAINWYTRTRSCKKCIPDNFVTYGAAGDYGVPISFVPSIDLSSKRWPAQGYCLRTLRRYQAEMQSLDDSALKEWCIAKRTEYEARMQHGSECAVWNRNRSEERSNELENIRQRRYEAIKEKLSHLGWGEEITKLEEADDIEYDLLSDHKLVKQPRELTDRIWGNIEAPLIDFMEKTKVQRLETSRRATIRKRGKVLSETLQKYALSQPLHTVLPSVADLAILPDFRSVIEDTPIDQLVVEDHFKQAMVDIPSIVTAWRKSKDEQLVAIMKSNPETDTEVTEATLRLATTFFRCNHCRREITYPRVLVHRCTTTLTYSDTYEDGLDPYFRDLNCKPWNTGDIVRFDRRAHQRAEYVLRDCGIMQTMPSLVLDLLDFRFECIECTDHEEGRLVMRWPTVVAHTAQHYKPDEEFTDVVKLAALSTTEGLLADLLEYVKMSPLSGHPAHDTSWVCVECRKMIPWDDSLDHLKERHPDVIPDDYVESEYAHDFDQYFELHLDANRTALFRPIRVNVDNPAPSFRDAFFEYLDGTVGVQLDVVAEQMAQAFLAGLHGTG
ncbi:hypothetical protein FPV67DRAFT_1673269 [Lyophyllum atratum]|nr:hypothetical protein FPV67DRAFT_1673269 [Lyophyllum atratum]